MRDQRTNQRIRPVVFSDDNRTIPKVFCHMHKSTVAILCAFALTAAGPPPTPTVQHVDRLFGMSFEDPYYWMEAGGPTFDAWLTTQAAYTRSTLDAIPGRAAMLEE